jgi:hypothetical protein
VTGGQLVCWASCVVPVVGRAGGMGGCEDRLGGGEACVMQANPVWKPVMAAAAVSRHAAMAEGDYVQMWRLSGAYNCATSAASSPSCLCVRGLVPMVLCQLSKLTGPASRAVHARARQCGRKWKDCSGE